MSGDQQPRPSDPIRADVLTFCDRLYAIAEVEKLGRADIFARLLCSRLLVLRENEPAATYPIRMSPAEYGSAVFDLLEQCQNEELDEATFKAVPGAGQLSGLDILMYGAYMEQASNWSREVMGDEFANQVDEYWRRIAAGESPEA